MVSPAPPPKPPMKVMAIVVACEQRMAEREADLVRLTAQMRELEADLKQAKILLAHLRTKAAGA